MKKKSLFKLATIIIILSVVFIFFYGINRYLFGKNEILYIATVGPFSGKDQSIGSEMLKGINFCLDKVNKTGGVNGKKIALVVFDDQNNTYLARKKALEISESKKNILAVIGHYTSDASFQGGAVYRISEIPAITASATNDKVTLYNNWYYRIIFNNRSQGIFLANYIKKIFNDDMVYIVYDQDLYGAPLSYAFKTSFLNLGGKIASWGFDQNNKKIDSIIDNITDEIITKQKDLPGTIFLSVHQKEAAKIIVALKRKHNQSKIIAGDSLGDSTFAERFNHFPEEKKLPGYFSESIYATSPILFDVAGEKAQQFRNDFINTYEKESGWTAVMHYEAAYILVQAIKNSMIEGYSQTLEQDRKKIQQYLSNLDSYDNSLHGTTGNVFFDTDGNVVKPLTIGFFHNKQFISAMTQLKPVHLFECAERLNQKEKDGDLIKINNNYMYKTNVVYTGIECNEITDIDMKNLTYSLNFTIWFRYQGKFDPEKIEFINAIDPIVLNRPAYEEKTDSLSYELYKVKGRFKADFLPIRSPFGQHTLGFSFYHKDLLLNNLVFVTDVVGMGFNSGRAFTRKLQQSQIINPVYGWKISDAWLFQNIETKSAQGKLKYYNQQKVNIQFSRFNFGVLIKNDRFSFRNIFSYTIAFYLLLISFILLLLFTIISRFTHQSLNLVLFLYFLLTLLILITSEICALDYFGNKVSYNSLENIVLIFDILWWFIPSIFLSKAIDRFVFIPIEKKTNHQIPKIVRLIVWFLIYTIALFGIIAFTFDQKLTGLLATSGVIAMIIGLAIQINIANIFSGIAINLERPFRVGDWVKIEKHCEGKVIDINWRATRVLTSQNNVCSIPNSAVSETTVYNYHYPDETYIQKIKVYVSFRHSPERIHKILMDAVLMTENVLDKPSPIIRFKGIADWAAEYFILPSFKDYENRNIYKEQLWKNIWKQFDVAEIEFLKQIDNINFLDKEIKTKVDPLRLLYKTEIFNTFSDEAKDLFFEKMKIHNYEEENIVIRKDDPGDSFLIIVEGVVSIREEIDGHESTSFIELARKSVGDIIGEMAFLTGKNRSATIVALSKLSVCEITKNDLAPLVKHHPEIIDKLWLIIHSRKQHNEFLKKEYCYLNQETETDLRKMQFLNTFKKFFS